MKGAYAALKLGDLLKRCQAEHPRWREGTEHSLRLNHLHRHIVLLPDHIPLRVFSVGEVPQSRFFPYVALLRQPAAVEVQTRHSATADASIISGPVRP